MFKTFLSTKSEFTQNVAKLMTGTILTQLIGFLLQPLIIRLYPPISYGQYSSVFAFVTLVSVILCWSYDRAIVITSDDNEAYSLTKLCVVLVIFSGLITTILLKIEVFNWLFGFIVPWYIRCFVLVWLIAQGINVILIALNTRFKLYRMVALRQIGNILINSVLQIVFGLAKCNTSISLIIANMAASIFSAVLLANKLFQNIINAKHYKIVSLLIKYRNFPLYQLPGIILDLASLNLSVLLINRLINAATAGQYALANKILSLPIMLVGASLGQVFYQEFAKRYATHNDPFGLIIATWKKVIILATPIVIILYFFAPYLFCLVFGDKWYLAGWFAKYLSIMLFFTLIGSATNTALIVLNRQRWFLGVTFIYFIARMVAVIMMCKVSLLLGIWLFILCEVIAVVVYNIPIIKYLRTVA